MEKELNKHQTGFLQKLGDQFEIVDGKVKCKCGHVAVKWSNEGFICGTITAYGCHKVGDRRESGWK